MTNNTIPNAPRELLEELRDAANESMNATTRQHQIDHFAGLIAKADALLSVPLPAGVDGLNTDRNAAFKACPESGCDWGSFYLGWKARGEVEQAIIDGLRGENERIRLNIAEYNEAISCYQSERDQQDQRIGELEAELARITGLWELELGRAQKAEAGLFSAALSAGKDSDQ